MFDGNKSNISILANMRKQINGIFHIGKKVVNMKYRLTLINRNGYTIKKDFRTIKEAKSYASFYPLESFFGWIYDKINDAMICQNLYKNAWKKCNNESFVPYF